ncbi:MAG TPA: DMT family transporter [Aquabacterium sp.]|uniref:DMT family transporter n=1 Tax=Aquabacterium sp. TaxID=1872578 RepID=UPI002E328471|nr:DMT family transporter [Aquabacterium sp.]HEX5373274.1 DMT family transporter [Aquabacterium sp.]
MTLVRAAASKLSAAWMMVLATVLFAGMGLCVKKASAEVTTAEVVFFRGLVGALIMATLAWSQRLPLRTQVPRQHLWRGVAGVSALSLWFYAMAHLPLATAVTLNYMSSVWMAVFLMLRQLWKRWRAAPHTPIPPMLLGAVLLGFVGVALVLRPTLQRDQWLQGLAALLSGMLSAWAYLQVAALGRSGEPEHRVVFYFSLFGTLVGLLLMGGRALSDTQAWVSPSLSGWAWLLSIGLFATAAQLAMTRAYAHGQPLAMASLQYLGIVHAFLLGVWFFDEPVYTLSVVGTVLIVVAGIAANRLGSAMRN